MSHEVTLAGRGDDDGDVDIHDEMDAGGDEDELESALVA